MEVAHLAAPAVRELIRVLRPQYLAGAGAFPWDGVDPIVVGSQIVSTLQTIESRQVNVAEASVLTVGTFQGGNRANIMPEQIVMTGTRRTISEDRRQFMKRQVNEGAETVAAACRQCNGTWLQSTRT